ncbi:hypothetical protein [Shimia abyssi]|uniref:Excinuclease ABC subunit B n=1 Tax=Shimia abyssi TaxID=1662395 RepID=A0A2P8F8U5_9RHOB|nr:hypothetical protein [Shimia abyssi]PSL18156.1 hypothetical protein CLV88_11280 [Shimia abyssi]
MRTLLLALALTTPAHAWQATVGDICTLSHATDDAEIFLTFDPTQPLYTLTVTLNTTTWAEAPWFAMRFDGPSRIDISTGRHAINGATLSVADRGFGNVLDGLEFNDTALAFTENQVAVFPLAGAAPEVRTFRECQANFLS